MLKTTKAYFSFISHVHYESAGGTQHVLLTLGPRLREGQDEGI